MLSMLKKEIVVNIREGAGLVVPLLFFVTVAITASFAIGPNTKELEKLGGAIMWIAMLLSSLLGLERLFQTDNQDGSLDQYILSSSSILPLIFVKSFAHWLMNTLPLVILSPLVGLIATMSSSAIFTTFATLLVGSLALSFLATLGAALTVSLPRSGLLLSILVLPLCLPMIIFALDAATNRFSQSFMILCSLSLFFIATCPLFASLALRYRSS